MPRKIAIEIGGQRFEATLHDNHEVADAIWDALPLETSFSTWGDEIYFDTGINIEPNDGQETVALGDLGYWPPGSAFCIFYGATPVSGPDEIRPASAVSVFGRVDGNPELFKEVRGPRIRVRAL